jgi:hypothetical protein
MEVPMQSCKWCALARELSKDETGHIKVGMCRVCYRKQHKKVKVEKKKVKPEDK